MSENCARLGCTRAGTHHLVAKVWALGHPKSSSPITAVVGLSFCRDHAREEAKSHEVIGDDFWRVVDGITRGKNLLPVDRASLELVPTLGAGPSSIEAIKRAGTN